MTSYTSLDGKLLDHLLDGPATLTELASQAYPFASRGLLTSMSREDARRQTMAIIGRMVGRGHIERDGIHYRITPAGRVHRQQSGRLVTA